MRFEWQPSGSWLGLSWVLLALAGFGFGSPIGLAAADDADRTEMAIQALSRLQGMDLNQNPKIKEAVLKVLDRTRGTANFLKLVQQFKLTDQDAGLLEVAVRYPANETGVEAMRLLLANKSVPLLQAALAGTNISAATKVAEALGNTGQHDAADILLPIVTAPNGDGELRKQAVRSLTQTPEGAAALVRLAREDKLAQDLKLAASSALSGVRWPEIRAEAANLLPLPQGRNAQPLPPLADLLKMKGDPANGAKVFANPTVGCMTCHQVKGQGVDFGSISLRASSRIALREASRV